MTPNGEAKEQETTEQPPTPLDDNLKLTEKECADLQAVLGRINQHLIQIGNIEFTKQRLVEEIGNLIIQRDNAGKKVERRHGLDPKRQWNIDPFLGVITEVGRAPAPPPPAQKEEEDAEAKD